MIQNGIQAARSRFEEDLTQALGAVRHGIGAALSSALIPRCDGIVQRAMERAMERGGWALRDFRVHRLVMQHPPMQSSVRIQFGLESA